MAFSTRLNKAQFSKISIFKKNKYSRYLLFQTSPPHTPLGPDRTPRLCRQPPATRATHQPFPKPLPVKTSCNSISLLHGKPPGLDPNDVRIQVESISQSLPHQTPKRGFRPSRTPCLEPRNLEEYFESGLSPDPRPRHLYDAIERRS